jgi:phosphoglycerate kinase
LLEDLPDPSGKRVLVRADLNVPLAPGPSGELEVADDFRIVASLPTLQWLLARGAKVTACSHLGRPKGHVENRFAMAPVRRRLEQLVAGVELMENLRFDPGEEADDPEFVRRLVDGHDLYVNDAFGAAHRSHASVVGPPRYLPSAAGRLLAREVEVLESLLHRPERPFYSIVGGAKLSDKLGTLQALAGKVEATLVGGGLSFTLLAALGHHTGASLLDHERLDACRALLDSGRRIVVPTDVVALSPRGAFGPGVAPTGEVRVFGRDLPDGWTGLDIGPETAQRFAEEVQGGGTILWNGPMGVFEDARFAAGTRQVAEAVASNLGFTVVGGGDTVEAIRAFGLAERIDHVSSGGGAVLELIERGDLPALVALRESFRRQSSA